jgi:hypothetical protein
MNDIITDYTRYMDKYVVPPESMSRMFRKDASKFVPTELKYAVDTIDTFVESKLIDKLGNSNLEAWKPIGECLWNYIKHEETLGNITKGMNVIELGTGSGSSSLIWSYMNYSITSIEIDSNLVKYAKELNDLFSNLQNAPLKIIEGSYYPLEFVDYMNTNKDSMVTEIECNKKLKWGLDYVEKTHFPICAKDIYEENNISLKNFDIIYAYAWPYQFPSLFDLYKKHARDDALFLAIGPDHIEIANKLGLKTSIDSHVIRK